MEHLEYFELPADPFQNDADARFYYESAPQKRARLRLLRGIHQRKALSVLIGGPGLGKTTLAHMLLRELEGKDFVAHYLSIPHEGCSSAWFLPNVALAFGVPMPSPQVGQLIDQIHAQLVAIVTSKRAPVLLIDEAQLFRNREAMEEFRGLLNLLHDGKKLLSLVLFGLPELDDVLKLDEPLSQRVEIRVEMTAMDWLESQAYVSHRLRLAGATTAVFAPDALESLFRWSGGVPRVLNTLADNALFEGFLTETKPVDSPVVQAAAQALGLVRAQTDTMPSIPQVAPAPDLLASTEVKLAPARPARPEPSLKTMPVAKPSPAARAPEPEPEPAATEAESTPDWLEPVSPMPNDVPAEVEAEPTPARVEEEPLLDAQSAAELDLDLEEVVAEDTLPPTPVKAIRAPVPAPEPEPEPELEPELAAEPVEAELDLGGDDDEPDFTFGSLVHDEENDLAPIRRTPPVAKAPPTPAAAKPAPAAKPATPAKPVAAPKAPTPAKPGPAIPADGDDSFDLRNLVAEEDDAPAAKPARKILTTPPPTPAPRPTPAAKPAPAAAEKDSDDDDLDALFDEIQIGD